MLTLGLCRLLYLSTSLLHTGPTYGYATNSLNSLVGFIYLGIHVLPAIFALVARSRRWIFIAFTINMFIAVIDFVIVILWIFLRQDSSSSYGVTIDTSIFSTPLSDTRAQIAVFFGGCSFLSCCLCCVTCVPVADCCRRCCGCSLPDDGEEDPDSIVIGGEDPMAMQLGAGGAMSPIRTDAAITSFGSIELTANPLANKTKW